MTTRGPTRLMRTLILAYPIAQIGDLFEEDEQSLVEEQNPSELEQLRKFEDDAECERKPYPASIGTDAATQTTDSIDKPNLSKEMGELATQCAANDRNTVRRERPQPPASSRRLRRKQCLLHCTPPPRDTFRQGYHADYTQRSSCALQVALAMNLCHQVALFVKLGRDSGTGCRNGHERSRLQKVDSMRS
jgi:hypothetical protein